MPNITTHCNRFSKVNMGQSAISRTHLHKTLLNPLYEHYQFMQLRLASCILLCVYARCKIFARPFYGRKIYISYIELKFIFNPYRIIIYHILHRILLYNILRHKCYNLLLRFITLSPHLVIPSQYKNG